MNEHILLNRVGVKWLAAMFGSGEGGEVYGRADDRRRSASLAVGIRRLEGRE